MLEVCTGTCLARVSYPARPTSRVRDSPLPALPAGRASKGERIFPTGRAGLAKKNNFPVGRAKKNQQKNTINKNIRLLSVSN